MSTPLLAVEHRWTCPNCVSTKVTREARPHTPFHPCRGLRGLMAPFVPAGTSCKVETSEREDYVGGELVQVDGNGRPVMNVITTRNDGQDCAIYAPCATASRRDL